MFVSVCVCVCVYIYNILLFHLIIYPGNHSKVVLEIYHISFHSYTVLLCECTLVYSTNLLVMGIWVFLSLNKSFAIINNALANSLVHILFSYLY